MGSTVPSLLWFRGEIMGFFNDLKRALVHSMKSEEPKNNYSQTFSFSHITQNVAELSKLPPASLDSAFKTAALTLVALCRYKDSPEDCFEMINFLKGPEDISEYEKQFLKERLSGKEYLPFSYFDGSSVENAYIPSSPLTISVYETPYSFENESWATLWVKSSGADNMRSIKLRKKPSTGQWFLNDIQCLSEIKKPKVLDKWA